MPKLLSSKEIIRVLERHNFVFVSQKGSHAKLFCGSTKATVILPMNKRQIPMGTFYSIVRQSKLSQEDFR